ncbi:MAG: hypothetical protein AAGK37_21910 [Pseudomonadota bacterium]
MTRAEDIEKALSDDKATAALSAALLRFKAGASTDGKITRYPPVAAKVDHVTAGKLAKAFGDGDTRRPNHSHYLAIWRDPDKRYPVCKILTYTLRNGGARPAVFMDLDDAIRADIACLAQVPATTINTDLE